VLLVGDFRYTLTFIRSLAAAGHRVLVGGNGFVHYARHSRFTAGVWEHPRIVGCGEEFVDALVAFLEDHPAVDLVMPMGDREIATVARHAARIPNRVRLGMPPPCVVKTCEDKAQMCRIAHELDIPQAPFATAHDRAAVFARANDLGFPCIVKSGDAVHTVFDQKAIICRTPDDLCQAFRAWPEELESVLVQRFADGPRHNIQLLAQNGALVCRVQTKTLRTDRPNYTGYTVESVTVDPPPAVDEHCRTLIRHLNYSGLGCAQFLIDEATGAMSFLEINPRLGAAFAVSNYCGIDFPRMAAELALSGAVSAPCPSYPPGKRIAWSYGDLDGIIRAREAGEISRWEAIRWLGRMLRTVVRAHTHATWSWRDPWPTLVTHIKLLAGAIRRALHIPRHPFRS
jgi:predicted ATP-grasp superfamily ATP-dependent carboligase